MNTLTNGKIESFHIDVKTANFFGLHHAERLKEVLEIHLSDRSYRPKDDDLLSDWVASVTAPAFHILAKEGFRARDFCTIGTGAGLDALAAIEILESKNIFITDLHEDVVSLAAKNIVGNIRESDILVATGTGDMISPVVDANFRADLLYENLPNIPIEVESDLHSGQNSSTFVARRKENLPKFVSQHLLSLHFLMLKNARSILRPGGRILSSIGGRVPLEVILKLASVTNYSGRILAYTWKVQSEPEDVIGGYAHWEQAGFGPFKFYPVDILKVIFNKPTFVVESSDALEFEQALAGYELSAVQALQGFRDGIQIGHTVAVLESTDW